MAFRGGLAFGFALTGLGLLSGLLLLLLYSCIYLPEDPTQYDYYRMMLSISGYALGTSTVSVFSRLGGSIYAKAADLGTDVIASPEESDEFTSATMATTGDHIGDIMEDMCGIGADIFDSCACVLCGSLIISTLSSEFIESKGALLFPFISASNGVIVSLLTALYAAKFTPVSASRNIKGAIEKQYVVGCVLTVVFLFLSAIFGLPSKFTLLFSDGSVVTNEFWCFLCMILGLTSGFILSYADRKNTSDYSSLEGLGVQGNEGFAWNLVYAILLELLPVVVPIACIVVAVYVALWLAGVYGVCLAALSFLPVSCIGATISGYKAISSNACGIMRMAKISEYISTVNGELDVSKKSTTRLNSSFVLSLAIFTELALFAVFITKTNAPHIDLLGLRDIIGILIGLGLPYAIVLLVKDSVNKAAGKISLEIQSQFARVAQGNSNRIE
eukprot:TRINITY_DN5053_c0_g3_i3.p1 TRINITY_DN5053_c0_g3~~TRINITY_DN5053_c0_g3_i3.p1  ORF type:complete len:444 (-),score=52.95 TRINITY_DN5053_c0_g3_i3:499-1830(-)